MRTEDNELIRKVGPGTPMVNLMRHCWFPILKSEEVKADVYFRVALEAK